MRGKFQYRFDRFDRGVNTNVGPYLLEDGFGRDARNVVSTERGSLAKRRGSTVLCSPSEEIKGLAAFDSPAVMIAHSASKLFGIASDGTISTLASGLADSPWSWVAAPSPDLAGYTLYGTSLGLGDVPRRWNGSAGSVVTWTKLDASPMHRANYLLYAGTRMWLAHLSGDGSAVRWSDLGAPCSYPSENITRFDPDDGFNISGLGSVGPYVLVFKPTKIWKIYDLDTSANTPLSRAIGCVSHRSIVETPKGTLWLSRDGVYSTDGSSIAKVSEAINPTLRALPAGTLGNATATYFEGHYLLSCSTSGGRNDITFDLDLETGAWWIHTIPAAQFATWTPSSSTRLYAAKAASTAKVLRCLVDGETQDEGAPFTSYWKSAWHTFGSTNTRKRVRQVHFDGTGRILFRIGRSFAAGTDLVEDIDFAQEDGYFGIDDGGLFGDDDGGYYGGSFELGEVEAYSLGVGRAFSVQLGNATADDFAVHSYTFSVDRRKD